MQNQISILKCTIHQENQVQFICMSTACLAQKLCCFSCQEIHKLHHSFLKNIDFVCQEILQHKQKQNELMKTFENLIHFNTFLVQLEKELKYQLICQDLTAIIQKFQALCVLLDEKVQIQKKNFCHFDSSDQLQVDKMLAHFHEARKLFKKGDKQNAIDKYSQVLELNENFIEARLDRGKMNIGLNYEQALFDFSEVLKQDDSNIRALKGLAVCQKMKLNYEEGLYYVQKGQKLCKISPQLNFLLADCYKFQGKNEEALHFMNLAIDQKKNKYESKMKVYYKNKAEILLGLNDLKSATIFINKALEIYQHYVLAIDIKERINRLAIIQNVIL